ncbi:MAG: SipW-dependent-type signal peptide-containing protein, partial [Clostridia bacterium]|nr:SipW-dependent-type signal peptide-containing protein [Clostridia bacterium]
MKKKILVLSLEAALVTIAAVGGTLAWFMDDDAATNVFTVGSIEIEQIEVFDET